MLVAFGIKEIMYSKFEQKKLVLYYIYIHKTYISRINI